MEQKKYKKTAGISFINKHTDVRDIENKFAIYAYIRKKDGKIMYIGKDSHINKSNRKSTHEQEAGKDRQFWHRFLWKNPTWYEYQVVCIAADQDWMEDIEASLIFNLKAIGMCEWNTEEEVKNVG